MLHIPRRIQPETPMLIRLFHWEEEGAVPFQLYRYQLTRCASWRRGELVNLIYSREFVQTTIILTPGTC